MDAGSLRHALDRAAAELAAIDRSVGDLARRRKLVAAFIASGEMLLGDISPGEAAPSNAPSKGPRYIGSGLTREVAVEPATELANSRRFNHRVALDALRVIASSGRPLSAREIHEGLHPDLGIGPDALYTLLYKRAYHGNHFSNQSGRFWPLDRPLPDGWDASVQPEPVTRA